MAKSAKFAPIVGSLVWVFALTPAHGYEEDQRDLTSREGEAAKRACNENDLHAGYTPDQSAAAEQTNVQVNTLNATIQSLFGQLAGGGTSGVTSAQANYQAQQNANLAKQARAKAQACEQAYKRCSSTAKNESAVFSAENDTLSTIPEFSELAQEKQRIARDKRDIGDKCDGYKDQADKARQQAAALENAQQTNSGIQNQQASGNGGGGGQSGGQSGVTSASTAAAAKPGSPSFTGAGGAGTSSAGASGSGTKSISAGGYGAIAPVNGQIPGKISASFTGVQARETSSGGGLVRPSGGFMGVAQAGANQRNVITGLPRETAAFGSGSANAAAAIAGSVLPSRTLASESRRRARLGGAGAQVSGMSLKPIDGITGPLGPTLFEKVSNQFRKQERFLIHDPQPAEPESSRDASQ